jgi:PKD repeat protein
MVRDVGSNRFNACFLFRFVLVTVIFQFFFLFNALAATQVTLEWNPNSDSDLAGYRIFCREQSQSYDYANPTWEGTGTTCTISNLDETKTYCFVARAFNSEGVESPNSAEVCQQASAASTAGAVADAAAASAAPTGNLALGHPVAASSEEGSDVAPQLAVDGNGSTRWSSLYSDPQWIDVDLGAVYPIDHVVLSWEKAYGKAYDIQVSNDAATWTTVFSETNGNGGTDDITFAAVNARYVRVYGTQRGTQWGYSLWEFEVYGVTNGQNQPPTADAGPDQTVSQGQTVLLNGSNSTDPDDGIATYRWTQTGGPTVTLSDPGASQSSFTAPEVSQGGVTLTFELTVVDRGGNQATDVCAVNVTLENEPPQANAGPDQTVAGGSVVTLDGSSSLDIDDGIAGYLWTQTGGPAVTLSNPSSSQATFTAPAVGPGGASLSFNLTVTDAGGLQNTDACIVNVSWQNQPPTAVVTPNYVETDGGATVTLDGSKSTDPDDGIASYLWTQVGGDPVSLSAPASAVTTFAAPNAGSAGKNLNFRLTVKDRGGLQSTADGTVYVRPATSSDTPPVADFSYTVSGQSVAFGDLSADSDGTIVSWSWDFGDGGTAARENPSHSYSTNGTYTVTLTVTDNGGASSSQSKTVTIATTTRRSRWGWR